MVSDSDNDSDCFVVSDELEASSEKLSAEPSDVQQKPAASTTVGPVAMASDKQPVKSQNFDLNRCCWICEISL